MKKYSEIEKNIMREIGFLVETHYREKTYSVLRSMGITDIKYKKNFFKKHDTIFITLERPGIFIGPKGILIKYIENALSRYLKRQVKFSIIEDDLYDYLIPYDFINDVLGGE